jgi:hypothetical protein
MDYALEDLDSILGRCRMFSVQTEPGVLPSSYSVDTETLSLESKRPECESGNSPSSNAEVLSVLSFICISPQTHPWNHYFIFYQCEHLAGGFLYILIFSKLLIFIMQTCPPCSL